MDLKTASQYLASRMDERPIQCAQHSIWFFVLIFASLQLNVVKLKQLSINLKCKKPLIKLTMNETPIVLAQSYSFLLMLKSFPVNNPQILCVLVLLILLFWQWFSFFSCKVLWVFLYLRYLSLLKVSLLTRASHGSVK